jgi:two-component system, response regulator YesN
LIRIVIVDDEKMIREGLARTMPWNDMGVEVVGAAGNGYNALDIIREKKPHIVLTDIRMPKMDGLQLLQIVKEENPKIKVVMLSGYDDFAYAQQAIKYGASDYLLKPINAEELQALVSRLIQTFKEEVFEDLSYIKIKKNIEEELGQYITAIRLGSRDAAFSSLGKLSDRLTEQILGADQFHKLYMEVINSVLQALDEDGFKLEEELREEYLKSFIDLFNSANRDELMQWLYRFTDKISAYIKERKGDTYSNVIKKALEYIEQHYNEELSAQKVAEAVYLSPNYFSHVFKKIRKESFTDYLNKIRVEKAKLLLSNNLYKVYEVSDMVGYRDYKYFSSVFKKLVGVSPTQYSELSK